MLVTVDLQSSDAFFLVSCITCTHFQVLLKQQFAHIAALVGEYL